MMRPIMQGVCCLIMSLILSALSPAAERFQVVFPADVRYATDSLWLRQIKTWGATGVTLRIYRSYVEPQYHQYDWSQLRRSLASITGAGLDVNIRLSTVFINGAYVDKYSKDDFHQTKGGEVFYNSNADRPMPMLNLTAERAFADLVRLYRELVAALRNLPGAHRVKFIMPALTPDDETEFPTARWGPAGWGWLTGYSAPEQEAFMRFLRERYNGDTANSGPARLDTMWGAHFKAINLKEIRIDDFDWERLRDRYTAYPAGRKDFLDFRRSQLKRFIDTCASVVVGAGYRLGVQFGSIYDEGVEFRSTYDVTPLVENVGLVIVDDVAEYAPNFAFVSDYERSLGRYWDWRKHRPASRRMLWGTEANWPGYAHIEPGILVRHWEQQLDSSYERGASVLSLFNWGTEGGPVSWKTDSGTRLYTIADLVRKDSVDKEDFEVKNTAYAAWRSRLNAMKRKPVRTIKRTTAVHLSCEQTLYSGDEGGVRGHVRNNRLVEGSLPTFDGRDRGTVPVMSFPLRRFVGVHSPYASAGRAYDGICDLVTNFMITKSPSFLSQYSRFYLTATSYYLPDSVYNVLVHTGAVSTKSASPAGLSSTKARNSLPAGSPSLRTNERGEVRSAEALEKKVRRDPNLRAR